MYNKVKKIYEMTENEIDEFMNQHLPTKKLEKDKYGEVFTSPVLINKILDLFPKSVWTNSKLTWLDPSVGVGFFMICVYIRLMNGLKKWEPNEKKRSKHIIENMLYMVEINKKNCNICKTIFGANVRLICGDFLADLKFQGRDDTSFDCIVGNPPFQDDYGLSKQGKRINGGKSKLYERIFLKSFSILKNGGYLSFVVPDNIFSGNGSHSYQTLIQNHIPFISFNPSNQSYFHKIQQPVCYFILHKLNKPAPKGSPGAFLTTIQHDEQLTFQIKLQDRPVNPIRNWTPHTEKLINQFVSNERNNVSYIRGKSLKSYNGHIYPIIFTPSKILHTNNPELAPGLGVKKAIIFSISPNLEFKMDYSGKFGAGPNTFYIPFTTNNQGKKLEKFLNSDAYKTLALATKTTRQYLKIAFIEHLKLTKIIGHNKTKKQKLNHNNKTRKHKY
jgi:hypothetical protein